MFLLGFQPLPRLIAQIHMHAISNGLLFFKALVKTLSLRSLLEQLTAQRIFPERKRKRFFPSNEVCFSLSAILQSSVLAFMLDSYYKCARMIGKVGYSSDLE